MEEERRSRDERCHYEVIRKSACETDLGQKIDKHQSGSTGSMINPDDIAGNINKYVAERDHFYDNGQGKDDMNIYNMNDI